MLNKPRISYVNHMGTVVDMTDGWLLQQSTDLNDWAVSVEQLNGQAVGFRFAPSNKKLPIVLTASNELEGLRKRDELCNAAQFDIEAARPGRLYYDGWYLEGYIVESKKSLYQYTGAVCYYELTFLAEDPRWTLETTHVMQPGRIGGDSGLDYPHDYPFDYAPEAYDTTISNGSAVPADFVMKFYGAVTNPRIRIGENEYGVDVTLAPGEQLIVDSRDKTITMVNAIGERSSAFSAHHGQLREGSGDYIFERIPNGLHTLSWDGSFAFDFTVYERRAEKRWS